jgi:hypothetical protein
MFVMKREINIENNLHENPISFCGTALLWEFERRIPRKFSKVYQVLKCKRKQLSSSSIHQTLNLFDSG